MKQVIGPTDTRFRNDQRFLEEGKVDEADEEKNRLEVKQRKGRKVREQSGEEWTPNFFRKVPHPYIADMHIWEFISDNNYWNRRETQNWSGLPDLW